MKKSEMIEIRDEKAKDLYEKLEAVIKGIQEILDEVKTENGIDALALSNYVNNFSFQAFLMHGSAYSLNAACVLCDKYDWSE